MKQGIPDEVLKGHTAVLGMTGSGKTSTEKLLIEQAVAGGARVCVLDTLKSDWWGITSSASGKSAGLPFKILGGPRGHVPLHSSAGKVIGQMVGSGKLPLSIVDMADFEAGGIQRFFVDFAQALWRNIRGVVYVVIEEAHEIAPKERAGFGAESMAIHWAKKLATGSRTKGIRLVVATQRVQSLHNAVLGSCQTVIAHQLMFDADQDPVIKWVKSVNKAAASEVADSIASLPVGAGWICSGRAQIFQKVHFPKFKSYDNTATPDGDDDEIDVKMAPVDQDELRALIGDELKRAEADDPKKLRERIAVLERDNQALERERDTVRASSADPQAIEQARRAGYKAGFNAAKESAIRSLSTKQDLIENRIQALSSSIATDLAFLDISEPEIFPSGSPASGKLASAPTRAQATPALAVARKPSPAASGDGSLSNPQRQLLKALAWWSRMGHDNPSRPQVAAIAGWKVTAGHLRNVVGSLNASGHTVSKDGHIALTDIGAAAAPAPDMGVTLIDGLRGVLTNPQKQIFECLLSRRRAMSRGDIAESVGWDANAGHLRNVVGSMRTLEIIDYPTSGMVELQSWVLG